MKKCNRPTEVFSRVVGYHRPVKNWNTGKREEFKQRRAFVLARAMVLAVVCAIVTGCASVEMPGDDGQVMKFRGFASDMSITIPGADPEQPAKVVDISAHATEGPLIEGLKSIAPYAALMLQ